MEESMHITFLRAMMMLGLMTIAINLGHYCKRVKFHYLGESAIFMLLGLVVGVFYVYILYNESDHLHKTIQMESKFFYMVLLPPIIFEGGYTLRRMTFWKNFGAIFSLAFVGGLYSTFITSFLVWIAGKITLPVHVDGGASRELSVGECLVFGSLISSTDPVTVLSLLPDNVDQRLYMLIFGESALNDAVAVILYGFFTSVSDPTKRPSASSIFVSILESVGVFIGSFTIGVLMAMIYAKLTKHVRDHESAIYQTVMLYVFAYGSYLVAELTHMTGIISVFFTGVAIAHYAFNNLDEVAHLAIKVSLRSFSTMCETFIFLYLGLGLVAFGPEETNYNVGFIIMAFIAIVISRTHVFVILGLKNMFFSTGKKIPLRHQILIWFCGLRGAVAFALGVSFLEHKTFDRGVKATVFGTTILVVFTTVLVFGGFTPFLLKWLRITEPASPEEDIETKKDEHGAEYVNLNNGDENDHNHQEVRDEIPVLHRLFEFDSKYIKPIFSLPKKQMQFVNDVLSPKEARGVPEIPPSTMDLRRNSKQSKIELPGETYPVPTLKSMSAGEFVEMHARSPKNESA